MKIRDEIFDNLESDNLSPSLSYWCNLLFYFEQNKFSLNVEEVRMLAYESERCRVLLNTDRPEEKFITKNGKELSITVVNKGLGIPKQDVNPSIHEYLTVLEIETETKQKRRLEPNMQLVPIAV